jgi:thymidylate synthase (FAD)
VYDCKIKREDARFLLPMGRRTTIVVSGTLKWIHDFIEKRNTPHAQWEIRNIARVMGEMVMV